MRLMAELGPNHDLDDSEEAVGNQFREMVTVEGFGPLRRRRPKAKGSGKGSGCPTEHFSLLKPMEHHVR